MPEEKKKETQIKDFEGYQITTFKLRGKATKLGPTTWLRASARCRAKNAKAFPRPR